jgi:hypothetical protein
MMLPKPIRHPANSMLPKPMSADDLLFAHTTPTSLFHEIIALPQAAVQTKKATYFLLLGLALKIE